MNPKHLLLVFVFLGLLVSPVYSDQSTLQQLNSTIGNLNNLTNTSAELLKEKLIQLCNLLAYATNQSPQNICPNVYNGFYNNTIDNITNLTIQASNLLIEELSDLENRTSTLENTVSNLSTNISNLDNTISQLNNTINQVNNTLSDRIDKLNTTIQNMYTNLSSDISTLNNTINTINNTLSNTINQVNSSLSTKIDQVNNTLSNRITNLENATSELNSTLSSKIDQVNSSLSKKINDINTTVQNLSNSTGTSIKSIWDYINQMNPVWSRNGVDADFVYRVVNDAINTLRLWVLEQIESLKQFFMNALKMEVSRLDNRINELEKRLEERIEKLEIENKILKDIVLSDNRTARKYYLELAINLAKKYGRSEVNTTWGDIIRCSRINGQVDCSVEKPDGTLIILTS